MLTNCVGPEEMQHHFIWVFTVYKSNRLGVSFIQFLKVKESLDLLVSRSTSIKLMKIISSTALFLRKIWYVHSK